MTIDPGRSPECWEYDVIDPDLDVRVKTRAGFSLDASSISNVAALDVAALDVAALETLTDADPVEDTLIVHDDSAGDNKQLSLNGLIDAAEALVDIGGTDTRCPIGTGIVASGGSGAQGDAHWEKKGNGYAEIWGRAWPSTSNASSATRTYNITLPINMIANEWTLEASMVDKIGTYAHVIIRSLPTVGSQTAGIVESIDIEVGVTTGYGYINWSASGRYV